MCACLCCVCVWAQDSDPRVCLVGVCLEEKLAGTATLKKNQKKKKTPGGKTRGQKEKLGEKQERGCHTAELYHYDGETSRGGQQQAFKLPAASSEACRHRSIPRTPVRTAPSAVGRWRRTSVRFMAIKQGKETQAEEPGGRELCGPLCVNHCRIAGTTDRGCHIDFNTQPAH